VAGWRSAWADAQEERLRAAEQDRHDTAEARRAQAGAAPRPDPARLVFLGETWATTTMAVRRLATRYERTAPSYRAVVIPAATILWTR
jgi:hypothetical protein